MANRSPPMPHIIGSTTPKTRLAAIAASTADPPRASVCAPATAASVWLAATMPLCEITIDRACDRFAAGGLWIIFPDADTSPKIDKFPAVIHAQASYPAG